MTFTVIWQALALLWTICRVTARVLLHIPAALLGSLQEHAGEDVGSCTYYVGTVTHRRKRPFLHGFSCASPLALLCQPHHRAGMQLHTCRTRLAPVGLQPLYAASQAQSPCGSGRLGRTAALVAAAGRRAHERRRGAALCRH